MWRDIIPGLAARYRVIAPDLRGLGDSSRPVGGYDNRWHHGLHWEPDFPEALTAGREELYLGFFYRNWGARPDAILEAAQKEYLRTYRQPGAMRAGFNLYRATPQDVADNEAILAQGKLQMPVLYYRGS